MKIDYRKNLRLHVRVQNKPKEWRLGQAYYNYAYELYPNETDKITGTNDDCFYVDDRIPAFLAKLNELLLEKKSE